MKLLYPRVLACLTLAILSALPALAESAAPTSVPDEWTQDAWHDERRALTDAMFDDLKAPGEDYVPITRIKEAYGYEPATPRQIRRLKPYDPNKDGKVTRDEFYLGFTDFVYFQVERNMGLDANDDGKLTLAEHALQVPDDRGRRDEEGYVRSQRRYFEEHDLNGDGYVTREEVTEKVSKSYITLFGGWVMGYKARAADLDEDGEFACEEFALLHGEPADDISAETKETFETWQGADDTLTIEAVHDRLGRISDEDQAQLAPHIDKLWQNEEARQRVFNQQ